ncbi:DegT/DnrJ/EryC1/StrS aminotransferase family protein [Mucilaginibacter sp. L3T2-6]|uniref:DegT/DnrJ/EryC1/StrS family aminotransferase n=1 Tax=Mucilaginibacter sp. L3T2-6 TaxID=3062491 RepID=UPI0026744379|nr:aminotransferase class I/II-fold pyridoxal phosphate-dependent enzyme [Mucilaginibacter sp. L3T2-6]MDO3642985.1 aminotransferase class I/II-fold pyridoxal phosphate-dependent enzyme [Mucilaginibacter sp. L3T2-6]MDV6215310.1 aminotransferase class I/II-fold pyridoxal phosphate-dependent enzyme [Mucilaginibacter sp. L3T2-6]
MNSKIWLSSPHLGPGEFNFVKEAFDTNWIAPLGPHVDGFESDLAKFTGSAHAAALSSGTAALHLALIMLGVEAGDEVICQSFTFSASANPIVYQGATPVFIDSEEQTWNMDPALLEQAIIDRIAKGKKPKAIIPVHLYGMPAQMGRIMEIANKYDIPVIEDAAEALGSTINGKAAGTFGLMGILSFNGNKIITTSGGGALISNDENYIRQAHFLATQARDAAPHYQHSSIGYNYRLSNVSAGIGRGQMQVLKERIEQRRAVYEFYKEQLSDIPAIEFLSESTGSFSNRWLTAVLVHPNLSNGVTRETLRASLQNDNIESRPLWKPMHLQPVFESYPAYINGVSEKLFNDGLCLPSGSNLTREDLKRVVDNIRSNF